MKGLLVYSKIDVKKNAEYIGWIIAEGQKREMALSLVIAEEILTNGIQLLASIDFVINRSRSYELSLLFELNGIRVFNNSQVTLIGNNKLAAYHYAQSIGFNFPKVLLDISKEKLIISKPNEGHGGEGIELVSEITEMPLSKNIKQEFISDLIGDIRFYVINNKIITAVLRTSNNKVVSNYSQGGEFRIYSYSEQQKKLIKNFMKGINFDYVGLDFFLTKDNKLLFNEVEDVVGSRMLSQLGINNTTELYLKHIYEEIKAKKNTK